jgi:alcohol dehydrogenase (cytochrome c)
MFRKRIGVRAWLAVTAAALAIGAGGSAALAQAAPPAGGNMGFTAKPDEFAPRLVAAENAPLAKLTPVTDATLKDPPAADWLMWRRTYDGWGYSPLDQINKDNVKDLRLAWAWSLPNGATENTPLEHDGVLFMQSYGDGVEALNAATGDLLWRFTRPVPRGTVVYFKRMMAISGEKLFIATSDKHLVALDIHTGKPVWDVPVAGDGGFTSGPMALNGKIIIGASNCVTSRCSITAHDANDGHELWRFYTVAAPTDPGGDTWNGLPLEDRFGGSTWTSGSYDPSTNLLYFGVGQPYPWNSIARGTTPLKPGQKNDALYTNNTLALDPDTGKLVWHYSHLPNDNWDMDYVFERTLVDLPVKGKPTKLSVTSGKMAIIEGLDAKTGKFVFAHDLGIQTIVKSIDPVTGKKTINPDAIPQPNTPVTFCPHPGGGRSTGATAYDPQTGLLYLPLQEHCTEMTAFPKEPGEKTAQSKFVLELMPGSDGQMGRLEAFDLAAGKTAWSARERAPQSTAVLPTAGGVLFEGDLDRYFTAYDARTGQKLWRVRLNDAPNSPPITYSVGGKQFVAVATGGGSPYTRTWTSLTPDIRNPPAGGATLWVFELPDRP